MNKCPECGHPLDPDDEPEEPEPKKVGECVDCESDIMQGEWHVLRKTDTDRIPDNTAAKVTMGIPDDETAVRICSECSDQNNFPDDA